MQYLVILVTTILTAIMADLTPNVFGVGCTYGEYPIETIDYGCHKAVFNYPIDNNRDHFLILRFTQFNLPPKDYVLIRSMTTNKTIRLYGQKYHGAFDAPSIVGDRFNIELHTRVNNERTIWANSTCLGFSVSGFTSRLTSPPSNESVCGMDHTQEAACYNYSPLMSARSRAVARLVINKGGVLSGCTGWLLGSEGHFVTNSQCISNQEHASRTRFEFNAEAPSCPKVVGDIVCNRQLACTGDIWRGTARFIATSEQYDYTLLLLDKNIASKYSYLKLRSIGPIEGEPIYAVQHPQAWGKRISDKTDRGRAVVVSLTNKDAAYRLDTQPMSSGSPILSSYDHTVVALHYGGLASCPNFGIRSNLIVSDMQMRQILPPNSII